jgi:hypothetical protein
MNINFTSERIQEARDRAGMAAMVDVDTFLSALDDIEQLAALVEKLRRKRVLIGRGSMIEIPREIAVCPYCDGTLTVYFEGWEQNKDGSWSVDMIHTDCDSEPQDMKSIEWEGWLQQHSDMPYVYQLPVDERIKTWINRRFMFSFEDQEKKNV